jgi:hypothetical protein
MNNYQSTIISQYGNSPIMLQLLANYNQYIDPSADLDNFFNYVWNINTAQGFGLDIWGEIVNVKRDLVISQAPTYFGFNDGLKDFAPFGQAPFYVGATTGSYKLSDDAYRTLILVKALANISSTTTRSLNQLLKNLFAGRGRCYVNDLGNMQMRYTFEFVLQPFEVAILTQSGALPRPTGVKSFVLQVALPGLFGFKEAGANSYPFGQGTFLNQGQLNVI